MEMLNSLYTSISDLVSSGNVLSNSTTSQDVDGKKSPNEDDKDAEGSNEEIYDTRSISFFVNGEQHVVTSDVAPDTRLADFLRDKLRLTGCKVLCREGGCGSCTVVATVPHPSPTPEGEGGEQARSRTFSVQACQLLVYACSGWSIETIESLGDRYKGYHPVQKALAGFYGTQCGYCSPGMVMTMYGELQRTRQQTFLQAEQALDGNLCRCTGYRPVLDAFKALVGDEGTELGRRLQDIEEAYRSPCAEAGAKCREQCGGREECRRSRIGGMRGAASPASFVMPPTVGTHVEAGAVQWYQPVTLTGLYNILKKSSVDDQTILVAGNTGAGVFKHDGPYSTYISLNGIPALQQVSADRAPLEVGSRVSLSRCISVFRRVASMDVGSLSGYRHLGEVADHWQKVANLAVRNVGSWSGNLALKNRHPEFPSDILVTLAACDIIVAVGDAKTGVTSRVAITDVVSMDLKGKVILSMTIPPLPDGTFIRTFKVTSRAVNAHAYVNAAFRIPVDAADNFRVTDQPGIFFGGVGPHFTSASQTAGFLTGQRLNDPEVLKEALRRLASESVPFPDPHQGSVRYRRSLVTALFYKVVLWLLKDSLPSALRSAGETLTRAVSSGQQSVDTDPKLWPLGQPVPKIESNVQVSGEAVYADDLPPLTGELVGVFLQSTVANARIDNIDVSDALAVPGVVAFVNADDIPGINSFVVGGSRQPDKVFATGRSEYAGQALGLIVAQTRVLALEALKLVRVTYSDRKKPVLTIREALDKDRLVKDPNTGRPKEFIIQDGEDVEDRLAASKHRVTGDFDMGTQYHLTMESLHACVAPVEDGYDVNCTTQHVTLAQNAVAQVLKVPVNRINVSVRRLGGGFGAKISRGHLLACAAAVASAKTKRPVRITLDLQTNMTLVGWREPYLASYEVGFDDAGKLEAVKVDLISDCGHANNDSSVGIAARIFKNVYHSPAWTIRARDVKTDTAANTWCRTPGHVEGIAAMENIIEHVAAFLRKDPLGVREVNLAPDLMPEEGGPNEFKNTILPLIKEKASLQLRKMEVINFNETNRWRKRGLAVLPMRYPFSYPASFRYTAQVTIYAHDGSISIAHGGIEMGQGINTKAAQVAATILGVPLSSIIVKPNTTLAAANSYVTGGCRGTDIVCHGVEICCKRLKARIDAVRKILAPPLPPWPELIQTCLHMDVDLSERYWTGGEPRPRGYTIWGGACLEVELDVLTGQFLIRRADVIEDAGRSMSPWIDVGQVEGAFVMGLGLFTSEDLQYDEDTGQKMVTGTWDYKPPTALDIPEDFRVTFLSNAPNPYGVLRSKATGEPPLCLSFVVVAALRQAVAAARADAGDTEWFPTPTPMTVERIQQLCLVNPEHFVIN